MHTKIQRGFYDHTRAGAGQQVLAIGNPFRFHTTLNVKHMRFCKFGSALALTPLIPKSVSPHISLNVSYSTRVPTAETAIQFPVIRPPSFLSNLAQFVGRRHSLIRTRLSIINAAYSLRRLFIAHRVTLGIAHFIT